MEYLEYVKKDSTIKYGINDVEMWCENNMREDQYKYSYTMDVDNVSKKVFKKTCKIIEKNLKGLKKEKLLTAIDGTLIQIYYFDGEEIVVYNDYQIYCVYVESNVDLGEILHMESIY